MLDERRFHEPSYPRPLRGVFEAIGDALRPVAEGILWLRDELADFVPGGEPLVVALAALLLALGVLLAATHALERRNRRSAAHTVRVRGPGEPTAAELERRAEGAERGGDLAAAVRLRFRAGLLRLAESEVIAPRSSITSREVARALRSARFARLAGSFDEIVYGDRPARREDVDAARADWPLVVEEATRR